MRKKLYLAPQTEAAERLPADILCTSGTLEYGDSGDAGGSGDFYYEGDF